MKIKIFLVWIFCVFLFSKKTFADALNLTSHLSFNFPIKDSGDEPGLGMGGSLGLSYPMYSRLFLEAKGGYFYGFEKDLLGMETQTSVVPFLIAGKFFFSDLSISRKSRFYFDLETGLSFIRTRSAKFGAFGERLTKEYGLSAGLGFGCFLNHFDINFKINFLDVLAADLFNYMGILVSFGYYTEISL